MGGDLSVDTLVSAYSQGIFPWFSDQQPILWWSPDPRLVLFPEKVNVSRSLRKKIRREVFSITCNLAFEDVIRACALRGAEPANDSSQQPSVNQHSATTDTWITESMHHAYLNLHQSHYAHSIEVWQDNSLVGGLYGVTLGNVFFGESMFSRVTDASKVALVALSCWLSQKGFKVIDCQVESDHLLSMGAEKVDRQAFMQHLKFININDFDVNFATQFEQLRLEDAINTL